MKFKRMVGTVTAALVMLSGMTVKVPEKSAPADAATVISLAPENKYESNGGKFQGWGTDLGWWANRVG